MKIMDLEQGSEAWLAWRRERRMASEAAAALGKSPYMSKRKLAEVKRGVSETFVNAAMQRGTDNEAKARSFVESQLGDFFTPRVIELGMYGASLDGISESGTLIEIKVPRSKDSELWKSACRGEIPLHLEIQMCQQYAVSSASEAFFCVFLPEDEVLHVIRYTFSPAMWDEIQRGWSQFWADYMIGELPEEEQRTDQEWAAAVADYLQAKEEADQSADVLEVARKHLIELAPNGAKGLGIQVIKAERQGTVNYKAIPELKGVDLDKYRGKPTSYFTVKEAA